MGANDNDPSSDFQRLARQYWNAWSDFAPASTPQAQLPGWKEGLAFWTQLAGQGRPDVDATLERMNAQAGSWFGAIQQLAAGFAGREPSATDIGKAWRDMLGAGGANPLADMFKRMGGADAHGIDQWFTQAAPWLGALRGESAALSGLPAFGPAREHQERLQRLAQAQGAYQQRSNDYQGLLAGIGKLAFERFERKLGERSEPGRQIESARALFDLWIDAAEEAWAEVATGDDYRRVYGALVNAQMQLRAALQREVEIAAGLFGLPTRSEVNGSHRKLAALERELRALRTQVAQGAAPRREAASRAASAAAAPAPPPAPAAARSRRAAAPTARRASAPTPSPATRKPAAAQPRPAPMSRTSRTSRAAVLPQVVAPRAVQGPGRNRKAAAGKTGRKGR